ncbi:MAG: TraR/DksA family transcriptional regulator [Actinobacteria bacterium]|nr:TraR/DksA family transcriptional regulator [Actinomycetota bacterium]
MAGGQYGLCESCGNSIPLERLDVLPYTTLCVTCAQKV